MKTDEKIKERICESNKKVSFSQRSPIETKAANTDKTFESFGIYFSVASDEVIESALFERVTRDCGGKLLRTIPVRRFRKINSDEWFSLSATLGNDYWNTIFSKASHQKAIEQAEENDKLIEGETEEEEKYPPLDTPSSVEIKTTAKKENKISLVKIAAMSAALFIAYKITT